MPSLSSRKPPSTGRPVEELTIGPWHAPRLQVDAAGWARVLDVLSWLRALEFEATGGDTLEVVRSNTKQRYQLVRVIDSVHRFIDSVEAVFRRKKDTIQWSSFWVSSPGWIVSATSS